MSLIESPQTLTITRPDDWHLHLRDGAALASVLPHSARQFARAIVMPNLKPPVTTTAMTLYLTDATDPDEIRRAQDSGFVHAVKLYPAGATTNSAAGVTDLARCYKTLEVMQEVGMPLLVHGEVTDQDIDLFDREAVFIERVMRPLRRDMPELKIVFEHITTRDAAQYVAEAEGPIAATITAHHLLYNRNELFKGGIRPHFYCLPVLKREEHRLALVTAATSGDERFFLGTDSAPHAVGAKETSCGCAGCYTALHALEMYAEAFDQAGALDKLEAFASFNGPDFYELPRNETTVTLKRETWTLPQTVPLAEATLAPLNAGEQVNWKML
jgi:dihydroorotase